MADTASWLLPSSALSVFQPSRRGSLGQGQHYLFGQSRCKRCLVQKQKPQHLGFHLYLSEMIYIDEHMGGSRHWILDCLQRTICTWTSSTSMSLCRWFALGNVRSWILQVDYIYLLSILSSVFHPIECPEVSEYPSFPKSTAGIKARRHFHRKAARWYGKMWFEVFSRPWCALASCQWGKRMEDLMDVALCFTNIWNIFIENHNFDDELRMFNVFHPDDPIAFLACNLYLLCGL